MTTFADLGIPFPLFEAPTQEASEYVGLATCVLCGRPRQHCFVLRIGCAILLPCPACATINGLDTSDRQATPCRACHRDVPFPDRLKDTTINVCYACLREEKGAITKDTEFGMVSWEQAFAGVTHGVPGLHTDEFETVLVDPEEDWYGVRLPERHLWELLRTPTYTTIQGETWLFCCKQPMTYIGEWAKVRHSAHCTDQQRAFLEGILETDDEMKDWIWESTESGSESLCVYLFRCAACGKFKANWDID